MHSPRETLSCWARGVRATHSPIELGRTQFKIIAPEKFVRLRPKVDIVKNKIHSVYAVEADGHYRNAPN